MAKIEGFITNLGKYNEGELIGKWIEFPISDDELQQVLKEIGCCYTDENGRRHNIMYEEFFFTDWNNDIAFEFGEYPSISEVNDIAERVEALAAYELDVLKIILEGHTSNVEEALQIVEHGYYTIWNDCINMADVAATMVEECEYFGNVPERLQCYIDYEKLGRDLAIESTFLEGDGYFVEVFN